MSAVHNHQECCAWDNYKFALYTKFRTPRMYRYAEQGDWDLIPKRCKTHPKEAAFVHKYAPNDTPLNRVMRTESYDETSGDVTMQQTIYQMKYKATEALLQANASSATSRDMFQRTPLHWACMDITANHSIGCGIEQHDEQGTFHHEDVDLKKLRGSSSSKRSASVSSSMTSRTEVIMSEDACSVILLLLERAPNAARMKDIEERTPLHYLVARNNEIPLPLLAKIVALCPEALTMQDEVEETPLDIVQSRRDEIVNVSDVISTLEKLQSMMLLPSSTPSLSPSIASKQTVMDSLSL